MNTRRLIEEEIQLPHLNCHCSIYKGLQGAFVKGSKTKKY